MKPRTEWDCLLEAIIAEPDNDGLRLIAADYSIIWAIRMFVAP